MEWSIVVTSKYGDDRPLQRSTGGEAEQNLNQPDLVCSQSWIFDFHCKRQSVRMLAAGDKR